MPVPSTSTLWPIARKASTVAAGMPGSSWSTPSISTGAVSAGVPASALQLLPGDGVVGAAITRDPRVKGVAFTGSTEVGRILLRQAADQVLKCSMELGGNAPFIVFDDADLDAAVEGAMVSKFRNNGQTCVCANRIYVQAGVYDAFAKKLAEAVAKTKVGDGLSAQAVHRHAAPLVAAALERLRASGKPWTVGPVALVENARVAVGDEVGAGLGALSDGHTSRMAGPCRSPTWRCRMPRTSCG